MNEIIEKLMHGVLVCIATDTTLVHIDRTDAEKIIDLLEKHKEYEKLILRIVWDVLHDGVSTDTKADQDFVYELILEKVNNYDKDVNRNGLPGEGS